MNSKRIAWCITGGGAHIREVVDAMKRIKEETGAKITVFMTRWGYEVSRIFGVLPKIRSIARGGYYEEFLVGDEGMYYIGRLNMMRYEALVIAPATANTVAKIVHGIADDVASALYAQASKSGVEVYILPTDIPGDDGYIATEVPCYIDREVCARASCSKCEPFEVCPIRAIEIVDGLPRVNLAKCNGCELCAKACRCGAVKCWERIKLIPRDIDLRNIEALKSFKGTHVLRNAEELYKALIEVLTHG